MEKHEKSAIDGLAAWLGKSSAPRRMGGVFYSAVRDTVDAAVAQGYNLHTIWEYLHKTGRFPASYETLRAQHARHNKRAAASTNSAAPPSKPKPAAPPVSVAAPVPKKPPADGIGGFSMQPMSKEELI
ncbi:MAG: hypothetical protein IK051_09885 [Rhodocyclaceae bacterium]|nr:hypothetical protein [Rhodocyclaceae bacterium]